MLDSIILKKDEYLPLYSGGSLIFGQEQDGQPNTEIFDPKFDMKQSFSGRLTQVEIWNTVLSHVEIKSLALCNITTLRPQNRVVTWESETQPIFSDSKVTDDWIANKVTFKDIPLESLCQKNIISNQFIWPRSIDYFQLNDYCHTMGALIPIINNNDQVPKVYDKVLNIFKQVNNTFPSAFADNTKPSGIRCFSETSAIDFWFGIKRNKKNGQWYSPYSKYTNFSNFEMKVSSESHNCLYTYAGTSYATHCTKKWPCGICKISQDHILYLKGLCIDDLDLYDVQYYVYGIKNNRPYFK